MAMTFCFLLLTWPSVAKLKVIFIINIFLYKKSLHIKLFSFNVVETIKQDPENDAKVDPKQEKIMEGLRENGGFQSSETKNDN